MGELEFSLPGADLLAVFSSSGLFLLIPYINPRGWRSCSKELLKDKICDEKRWNKKPPENRGSCLLEMAHHPKISSCCTRVLEKIPWDYKIPWEYKTNPDLDTGWLQNHHKNGEMVRGLNFRLFLPQPREWFPLWNFAHGGSNLTHPPPTQTVPDSHSCHNGSIPTFQLFLRKVPPTARILPHGQRLLWEGSGASSHQRNFSCFARVGSARGVLLQGMDKPPWSAPSQGQIPADPTSRESQNSLQLSWAAARVILHDGEKLFWADLYILSTFKYIKLSFDSYFQCQQDPMPPVYFAGWWHSHNYFY